ncbi:MAG TPA: hypothetical protein VIX84_00895, partial [Acidimicrobiales bacterium]
MAVLVMTAGSAAAANRGTATALAPQKPHTVPYTATGTCATISQTGSTRVIVCAGTNSIYGSGAAVATIMQNGLNGTDTSIEYDANGARRVKETFTAAVGANGIITLTGSGTCTGGTGVYKHAKCSYSLTGTTNPQTNVSSSMESALSPDDPRVTRAGHSSRDG